MYELKEKKADKNLYSFDIFDTLVTRKTCTPVGIFYLMQEILKNNKDYCEYFRENFKTIRCETEAFVRENLFRNKKWQDITFDEIYNRIQINHSLTDKETKFLKELEIKCEIENLIPIKENIQKLQKLVSSGNKVILISDMYHSEEIIKKILTNIDPIFNNIKVYVSSEYKKSKAKGDLYKYIKSEYQPDRWEHCGDNICADCNSAKQNKIIPHLYKYVKLKEYEKYALKENNLTTEYIIGTAKNLRLHSKNEKYNFGASFAAPILYQYVNWILDSSLKNKIEHLYFIARDGYIPKLIADIVIKENNLPIKTHYIYGSRKAWRIVTEETVDDFLNFIFDEYVNKQSPKFIAQRLGISYSEFEKFTGIKCSRKPLKGPKRKVIFDKFINCKDLKNLIINKNKEKSVLLKQYFQQEIDLSKNNFAFVDINGSGRSQDILAKILSPLIKGPINTFYFCTEFTLSEYSSSIKRVFINSTNYCSYWIELLCRNPDGQTIGYQNVKGIIRPLLERINHQRLLDWGYNDYINGILDFTREFNKLNKKGLDLCKINFYYVYFTFIMKNIDKETADILGTIPYADVGNEKLTKECAPSYNLMSLLLSKIKKDNSNDLYFISKGRSDKFAAKLIDITLKYKSLRKFFIDIHIHKKKGKAYICILGKIIDLHKFGYKE